MAVENKYINPEIVADKAPATGENMGAKTLKITGNFETVAADDNLTVLRIVKSIPWNAVIIDIKIFNDAIAGSTDWDLGIYETSTDEVDGAALAAEVFANTLDMSAAAGRGSAKDGLENLNIDQNDKPMYIHAGETFQVHKLNYDIAFQAVVHGSAVGTIAYEIEYRQG